MQRKRFSIMQGTTSLVINERTHYNYRSEDIKVGTMLMPFLWRTQFMSYSALLHMLRMARALYTEMISDKPNKVKYINNVIDYYRELDGEADPKIHQRLVATICNIVLGSEGLGKLPEELRKYNDFHEEGKITGFTPKREGGF